ncbi:hypothetical protein SVIOM74S_01445 [Streptomyces violarus]
MESVKKVGRIAGKAILYFEIVTTVILLIAVGLGQVHGNRQGLPPSRRPTPRTWTA